MGHIRLAHLPRTRRWKGVIKALAVGDVVAVGGAIARAADDRLAALANDPALAYLYWLLTRLTWHARSEDFLHALRADGINVGENVDGLRFLGRINQEAERGIRKRILPNALTHIALRAFNETVGGAVHQRAMTLFGVTGADVQRAFRDLSTKTNFANLARRFFSSFLGGFLQFIASKETSNHVGITCAFLDSQAVTDFEGELQAYALQCTRILEDFSGDWYSKHNWLGDIDENQSRRFVAYTMEKLRDELKASGSGW
jgi:hypothetical protein